MADHTSHLADDVAVETAEAAFRRIARRKLLERNYPEDQIDSKLSQLLCKGASVHIDAEDILQSKTRP